MNVPGSLRRVHLDLTQSHSCLSRNHMVRVSLADGRFHTTAFKIGLDDCGIRTRQIPIRDIVITGYVVCLNQDVSYVVEPILSRTELIHESSGLPQLLRIFYRSRRTVFFRGIDKGSWVICSWNIGPHLQTSAWNIELLTAEFGHNRYRFAILSLQLCCLLESFSSRMERSHGSSGLLHLLSALLVSFGIAL